MFKEIKEFKENMNKCLNELKEKRTKLLIEFQKTQINC